MGDKFNFVEETFSFQRRTGRWYRHILTGWTPALW